jgi:hypothetical protein
MYLSIALATNLAAARAQVRVRSIRFHFIGLFDPLRQKAGSINNPPKCVRRVFDILRSLVPQERDPVGGARGGWALLVRDKEYAKPGKVTPPRRYFSTSSAPVLPPLSRHVSV